MPTATYEFIGSATSNGSSSSLNLSNISQAYKHLKIIAMLRSGDSRNGGQSVSIFFNNSGGTAYSKLALYGSATSIGSYGQFNGPAIEGSCFMNGSRSGVFQMNEWWVMDYSATDKYKSTIMRTGGFADTNNSGTSIETGLWTSTNAINRITMNEPSNINWVSGSYFAVWGLVG